RPDLMERIATDSGGNVLASADGGAEVLADFKQSLARTHPVQIEYSPAWDRTWILLGALALWTISWAIRRSGGLL
ncbi:MAG TPA: hypothetical protein VHY37_11275, partial [Tepidisphaeraceae bacterium]|nr:hypothetical protein [Tepidisphaeraceae bacterium]